MIIYQILYKVLIKILPKNNARIYRLCKSYVDTYNGDNDDNLHTNGEYNFLKQHINKCKVVFDVGANSGEWTNLALSVSKDLEVHCFEPSGSTFKLLQQKNFLQNIHLNNFGLGSAIAWHNLYISEDDSGMNSIYLRQSIAALGLKVPENSEVIQIDTLDNYCSVKNIQNIDLLKVDVEGHELQVLLGSKIMLTEGRIKLIQFEYGGAYIDSKTFLKDIFDLFEGLEYSFYKLLPNKLRSYNKYDPRLENFQYQNWIIVHKNFETQKALPTF